MELIRIIWVFNFFFFALTLIFMWSKIAVILGKIKSITSIAGNIRALLSATPASPEAAKAGEQRSEAKG